MLTTWVKMLYTPEFELTSVHRLTEWHSPCRFFFCDANLFHHSAPELHPASLWLFEFRSPRTSNQNLVNSSGVLDLAINDHYLVHVVLNMKAPKQTPNYINTRSFKNYRAEQFSIDIAHIPWDTVDLMESVDGKLDAFNDLFLTCLDNHAPIKTVKLKCLQNPSITSEIEKLVKTWNRLHRRARKSGSEEDWQAFMSLRRDIK